MVSNEVTSVIMHFSKYIVVFVGEIKVGEWASKFWPTNQWHQTNHPITREGHYRVKRPHEPGKSSGEN